MSLTFGLVSRMRDMPRLPAISQAPFSSGKSAYVPKTFKITKTREDKMAAPIPPSNSNAKNGHPLHLSPAQIPLSTLKANTFATRTLHEALSPIFSQIAGDDRTPSEYFQEGATYFDDVKFIAASRRGEAERLKLENAVLCYQRAAEQGHVPAMLRLGICYRNKLGTERKVKLALHYSEKAILGYEEAARKAKDFGEFLRDTYPAQLAHVDIELENRPSSTDGIPARFYKEGEKLHKIALHLANPERKEEVFKRAFDCFTSAVEETRQEEVGDKIVSKTYKHRYAQAMFSLAACYHDAHGTPQNIAESLKWCIRAGQACIKAKKIAEDEILFIRNELSEELAQEMSQS